MARKRIVVVGSSFAGLAAACEIKRRLGERHDVTVISKSDQFVFTPSLAWLPFGMCPKQDLSIAIRPILERQRIRFKCAEMTRLDPEHHSITTKNGEEQYDFLLIATGCKPNFAAVPGLGPRGYTQSIATIAEAESARAALQRLQDEPGPILIGGVQKAVYLEAACQFLYNMAAWVDRHGLRDRAPISYLSSHSNSPSTRGNDIGLFGQAKVEQIHTASVKQVEPQEVQLSDGTKLPFVYAMLMPPALGVDAVRKCEEITDASGFVTVNDCGQSVHCPEIFGAGDCCAATSFSLWGKPEHASEQTARMAAHNLVTQIDGGKMSKVPVTNQSASSVSG